MKRLILSAILLSSITSVNAMDIYINGARVEVDRLEIWTKNVENPGVCANPEYDFYDTDKDGNFTFGGKEFCYDPCSSTEPWICGEVVSDPPAPPGSCDNPQYDFYDGDQDGETDFGLKLCYDPCTYTGPSDLVSCD